MAKLELTNLRKVFAEGDDNRVVAVDDLSLSVDDGEFLVLVGPSGCGKSTTLRMIAGLESITDGSITLAGQELNDVPARDRDIAMVFQSYALYPHMTVEENMAFGLEESTSLSDAVIKQQVHETADLLDIEELLPRTPSELSGGQQQRVALGRAIVRDPEVFLLDEPLSNLDAKLRAHMRTELSRLQDEFEITTIHVTHDQTEAMTMGDRIAILNDGQLQQVGTPLECYHEPVNRFVAGFLGEPAMNFIRGTVTGTEFTAGAFQYPLPEESIASVPADTAVELGVRPEDLILGKTSPESPHTYQLTVDVVEPMGNENIIHLRHSDATTADHQLVATTDGMHPPPPNATTPVQIPPDAIHLFDATTGDAIHNRRRKTTDETTVNV